MTDAVWWLSSMAEIVLLDVLDDEWPTHSYVGTLAAMGNSDTLACN